MATIKDIAEYSYEELKTHLDKLKNASIEATKDALEKARLAVLDLEIKLEGLTGISVNPPKTRGRKKGSKNKAPVGKPSKGKKHKFKRGELSTKIVDYVKSTGSQTIPMLTEHTGAQYQSVFQTVKGLVKKGTLKKVKDGKYDLVR